MHIHYINKLKSSMLIQKLGCLTEKQKSNSGMGTCQVDTQIESLYT